jgi:cobalamin synthesis protein cobW-like protein
LPVWPDGKRRSRLVLITQDLERDATEAGWLDLQVPEARP